MEEKTLEESIMPWVKRHEICCILSFSCAAGFAFIGGTIAIVFGILCALSGCRHVFIIVEALDKSIKLMDTIKHDMEAELKANELEKGKK